MLAGHHTHPPLDAHACCAEYGLCHNFGTALTGHAISQMQPLLKVEALCAGYGDVQVLWGVDLEVPAGSIVSVVGSNGAGKTSLLLAISGVVRVTSGSVGLDGNDITGLRADAIVKKGVAHVPEGRRLIRTLSVRDNLLLGAFHRNDKSEIEKDLEYVYSIFPILRDRASQDANTLSGGQQQMCAIGRGIMGRPKLLIIDELSLGLAPAAVEAVGESLQKINAAGTSILLVEQDVVTAFELSHYGYVIESGRVRLHGATEDLLRSPEIRSAYLGAIP
jgi:branched-chain amino acid transport system ATP-binding protein